MIGVVLLLIGSRQFKMHRHLESTPARHPEIIKKMTHQRIDNIFSEDHGQTMVEYTLALGLISAGIVLAFTALGTAVSTALLRVVGYF